MFELANYAIHESIGRTHSEDKSKFRTDFQRDKDRIIHSSAFRRLMYKTQVFVNHEGDLFRTRLTHSLEVAQIGRTVAYSLGLNYDLVEAICLAHDLGHTPFGHSGQDILNHLMHEHGGFEHNLQSLRIVDELEQTYPNFDGLNLTFETREGILKHCSPSKASTLGAVGLRFINNTSPSLEAQLANIADEIAYNYHDMDDGLRAGLLDFNDMLRLPIIENSYLQIKKEYPDIKSRRLQKELVRRLIGITVDDLIENTRRNLLKYNIDSLTKVQTSPIMVAFGENMAQQQRELKKYLLKNMCYHHHVTEVRYKSTFILEKLFLALDGDISLLPQSYQENIAIYGKYRVIADYISGMTDRYAYKLYNKLFSVENI